MELNKKVFIKDAYYITTDHIVVNNILASLIVSDTNTMVTLSLFDKNIKELYIPDKSGITWLNISKNSNLLEVKISLSVRNIHLDHHVNIINFNEIKDTCKVTYKNFKLWN